MSKGKATGADEFRFRDHDQIGAADADQDSEFLNHCFVDTGALAVLLRTSDHRFLVLGGTGTGKTALLHELEKREDRTARLVPDSLALQHVCNSTLLSSLDELGVHLDVFYKMLWRHVLAVELLKLRFPENDGQNREGIFARLQRLFSHDSRKEQKAIEYLKRWGQHSFWEDSQYRVREITSKLESELNSKVDLGNLSAGARGALTQTKTKELVQSSQRIISEFQANDLGTLVDLVRGVMEDDQKKYFVLVDGLDEPWVEEKRKQPLVAALLASAREFSTKVETAKVVVALRDDLFEHTFRTARPAGFQKEKYDSSVLHLRWRGPQLLDVLDKRIGNLVRRRYTNRPVDHSDVLPPKVHGKNLDDFLTDHLRRPRDVIQFFNICIEEARGSPRLGVEALQKATGKYSRSRFHALGDEWATDFPNLRVLVQLFEGRAPSFKVSALSIEALCTSIGTQIASSTSPLERRLADQLCDSEALERAASEVAVAMYRIGLIGLKLSSYDETSWIETGGRDISAAEVEPDTSLVVHAAFRRALGVRD